MTKEITQDEWVLIETIRNYRKAYPNGAKMLEVEIYDLLDELMSIDYSEEETEESED